MDSPSLRAGKAAGNNAPPAPEIEHADTLTLNEVSSIDAQKKHADYGRIDEEVAEYAGATRIDIDPETNKRLKTMIDKRILTIMIVTYFMQALDKGAILFVSIMNFNEDNNLHGQQVSTRAFDLVCLQF